MKREITLMIYTKNREDVIVHELIDFCRSEGILIKNNELRSSDIYDFGIEGNTKDYEKIVDRFGDKVRETYFAELGNIFDLDQDTLDKWKDVILRYSKHSKSHNNLFSDFCDLIKDIKDINKFEHLLKYPLDDTSDDLLRDRISQLKGEKTGMERWANDCLEAQTMVKTLELVKEGKYVLKNDDISSLIDILKKSMK